MLLTYQCRSLLLDSLICQSHLLALYGALRDIFTVPYQFKVSNFKAWMKSFITAVQNQINFSHSPTHTIAAAG